MAWLGIKVLPQEEPILRNGHVKVCEVMRT